MILVDEELEKLNIMELICKNPLIAGVRCLCFSLSGVYDSQPRAT